MPPIPEKDATSVMWTDDAVPPPSMNSTEHADSTITTYDTSSGAAPIQTTTDIPTTAQWTRYLPEAYGIRKSVESSKYRWCARESAMWGIATGSAMALHRMRMNSPTSRVIHVGFFSVFVVMGGSYYFCVKRRDYQEQMIELLMQLNAFDHAQNMPPERPIDQTHPFVMPDYSNGDDSIPRTTMDDSSTISTVPTKQYVAHIPERKDWQAPIPTQDAADVFQPYRNDKGK
jgi:hypothetical protein